MAQGTLNKGLADRDKSGKFINGHIVTDANKQALRETMVGKAGEQPRHWRGGMYTNSKGYVMVYCGERDGANKSGDIPQHRLVAEEFWRRELNRDEVVHHINGIRDDNRPENLWVFNRKEHRRMHHDNPFDIVMQLYNQGKVGFSGYDYLIKETE